MSANSKIEWCEDSWNPVVGCSKVSPGCKHCYAINHVHRMAGNPNPKIRAANEGLTIIEGGHPNWTGKVRLIPERLEIPLRKRKPTRYFVNSLSDLFHKDLSRWDIGRVFASMAICDRHIFQILTKRSEEMCEYSQMIAAGRDATVAEAFANLRPMPGQHWQWPLPNVWLGVSVEDQQRADERIPLLLQTPAAIRFLSVEPLLGPVNLSQYLAVEFCQNCGRKIAFNNQEGQQGLEDGDGIISDVQLKGRTRLPSVDLRPLEIPSNKAAMQSGVDPVDHLSIGIVDSESDTTSVFSGASSAFEVPFAIENPSKVAKDCRIFRDRDSTGLEGRSPSSKICASSNEPPTRGFTGQSELGGDGLNASSAAIRSEELRVCECHHLSIPHFLAGIHWIICGGESGPGARPMHPDWARSIRDQCEAAGVPFFFKQWGAWEAVIDMDGRLLPETYALVGKKKAGRLLDGRTWDEMPGVRP